MPSSISNIIHKIESLQRRKDKLLAKKRDILLQARDAAQRKDDSGSRLARGIPSGLLQSPPLTNWADLLAANAASLKRLEKDLANSFRLFSAASQDPLVGLPDDKPIVLLPLRLEVRFVEQVGNEIRTGREQLWIRVFPDSIASHHHDPDLTAQEILTGRRYWKMLWEKRKETNQQLQNENRRTAWSLVANLFDANRANWIIQETRPRKLPPPFEQVPDYFLESDLEHKRLSAKKHAWSQPTICKVMPDYLELRLYDDKNQPLSTADPATLKGKLIPYRLQLGPDPVADAPLPGSDKSWAGTGVAWLEDFDEAVRLGMGFKIDLKKEGWTQMVFSKILVFGVRTAKSNPADAGKALLEELFANHRYSTGGLSLLRQGTPTNNTDEKDSGYVRTDEYSESRFKLELQPDISTLAGSITDDTDKPDSLLLTEALGLDIDIFSKLDNTLNTDYRHAIMMNRALYPATLGFLAENLLHPLFTENDLKSLRTFFTQYVTGRGPLPALRVGTQPYGVLLTSNFDAWQTPHAIFPSGLHYVLALLNEEWKKLVKNVISLQNIPVNLSNNKEPDPVAYLDEVLSLHPASVQFWQRMAYCENLVFHQTTNSPQGDRYRNKKLWDLGDVNNPQDIIHKVFNHIQYHFGITRDIRSIPEGVLQFSKLVFDPEALLLDSAFLVDNQPLSEFSGLAPDFNYLEWLQRFFTKPDSIPPDPHFPDGIPQDPYKIAGKMDFFGDRLVKAPLLYLYLLHTLRTQLYKCAYYWLKDREQLLNLPSFSLFAQYDPALQFDPALPDVVNQDFVAGKEFYNIYAFDSNYEGDITPAELLRIDARLTDSNNNMMSDGNGNNLFVNFENTPTGIREVVREDLGGYLLRDLKNILNSSSPRAYTEFNQLEEYRFALKTLEGLSTARLERCFVEHLDCLNYRLDAWHTGLFYQKLKTLRKSPSASQGLYLGAYGWLENVGASPDMPEPGGFIQAPSMAQAKTAALLRNAYLHYNEGSYSDLMAVNLSSARVREAMYLFDGLRKRQELGALLGYQLERGLHDAGFDALIKIYREAFPMQKKSLQDAAVQPTSPSAATTENPAEPTDWLPVTNGLALVQALDAENPPEYGTDAISLATLGGVDEEDKKGRTLKLKTILNRLKDNLDAMKDLLVTESVHQMVLGNYDRAGALLKSIGSDLTPPAILESMGTPRTAETMVTHRVCLLFETSGNLEALQTPKARMEPGINQWLGNLLGPLSEIVCKVSYKNQINNNNPYVNLSELGLEPIDLIYLVSKGSDTWQHELGQRVGYAFRQRANLADNIVLEILFSEHGRKTFIPLLPLLTRLKDLICSARPMHGEDADLRVHAEKANPKNYATEPLSATDSRQNTAELLSRLELAIADMQACVNALKGYFATPAGGGQPELATGISVPDVRNTLLKISHYDFPDAVPQSARGEGAAEKKLLAAQINNLLPQIENRIMESKAEKEKGEKLVASSLDEKGEKLVASSLDEKVKLFSSAVSKLLGNGFQPLPRFSFSDGGNSEKVERAAPIQSAYVSEAHLFNFVQQKTGVTSRRLHLQNWLDGVAKVRQRVATLEWVRTLVANSTPAIDEQGHPVEPDEVNLHILQLPYEPGDAWLGLEFPEGTARQQNKLSLLLHHPGELFSAANEAQSWCGLVVDDWAEAIPGKEELTGVAMNYSQPSTQPPQTILLAVAPDSTGAWSTTTLVGILNDTLQRAKQRAVDARQLADTDWAGLLPGLMAEIVATEFSNNNRDTVSLNFAHNVWHPL